MSAKASGRRGPRMRKPAQPSRLKTLPNKPKSSVLAKSKFVSKVRLPQNQVTTKLGKIAKVIFKVLKMLIPRYFRNSWGELRLVVWPNRAETRKLLLAVFAFAIIFGLMIAGVDKVLDEIFKKLVLK